MTYTLLQLVSDVMGRLGETASPSPSSIPGPADIIALRVENLLPEVGAKLLREAPQAMLGAGMPIDATPTSRLMPCGLYAAEVPIPEDFVRFLSAKMIGWERSVDRLISPGDSEWGCQWSEEPGIAGNPSRPRIYMSESSSSRILRLIGSKEATDTVAWLRAWRIPRGQSFHFPTPLYENLVKEIMECRLPSLP